MTTRNDDRSQGYCGFVVGQPKDVPSYKGRSRRAHYAAPLFYDDRSAARLLKQAPRHINVFKLDNDLWPNGRYVAGPAHYRRTLADDNLHNYAGRAVYRIVVKLKAVSA